MKNYFNARTSTCGKIYDLDDIHEINQKLQAPITLKSSINVK